jgi:hypothetical protein
MNSWDKINTSDAALSSIMSRSSTFSCMSFWRNRRSESGKEERLVTNEG